MYINPVLYSYSADKYGQINQDFHNIASKVDSQQKQNDMDSSIFELNTKRQTKDLSDFISNNQIKAEDIKQYTDVIGAVPVLGKIESAIEKIKDNDIIPAGGLASLALLNGPEDIREAVSAYKQIKALFQKKEFEKPYDYKTAQHPFSFFRGMLLNDYVNPFSKKCKFPKIASLLINWDKSLWDTSLSDIISEKFTIKTLESATSIEDTTSIPQKKKYVKAYQFHSPSKFGNLTARAMTRTPVLGLAFSGAMEAAHMVKEIKEGDNPLLELGKSTVRLAANTALTGYLGAIGSKFGPAGSIAGMGLATVLSNKIERFTDRDL